MVWSELVWCDMVQFGMTEYGKVVCVSGRGIKGVSTIWHRRQTAREAEHG